MQPLKRETPFQLTWRFFKHNRPAVWGLLTIAFFAAIALLGSLLTQGSNPVLDPYQVRLPDKLLPPLAKPSASLINQYPEAKPVLGFYPLGTDNYGRDVFARMLEGAQISILVGLVAVGISTFIGIILGALAGFFRILDPIIMRGVDVMLSFPTMFLLLTVIALLPPSMLTIMIVIGMTSWMGTCRFIRAEFLSLREQDYVLAARTLGVSPASLMFRHMLPNAWAPVLVSANLGIASAILFEASLSFLGLGVPPPQATWGNILSDGKDFLFDAPHLTFIPGLAIFIMVLAFFLFGEGLREATNPKLRR